LAKVTVLHQNHTDNDYTHITYAHTLMLYCEQTCQITQSEIILVVQERQFEVVERQFEPSNDNSKHFYSVTLLTLLYDHL